MYSRSYIFWCLCLLLASLAGVATNHSTADEKLVGNKKEQGHTRLTPAEFQRLHKQLQIKDQPWAAISWQPSITEARRLAAKENKPILLFTGNGHLLACG